MATSGESTVASRRIGAFNFGDLPNELATGLFVIAPGALAPDSGEYLTLSDFHEAADAAGKAQMVGTYAFGRLAVHFAWEAGPSTRRLVSRELVNTAIPEEKKSGVVLLGTQEVFDTHIGVVRDRIAVPGLKRESILVINSVLFDSTEIPYYDDEALTRTASSGESEE